jgi:hypothetical protein
MLAGLVLAIGLCQAEPAPPEPGKPPPPAAAPVPSPPDPDAEPADYFVGLAVGGSRRLAPSADDVPPALGFSVSTLIGRYYALLGEHIQLGVAFHFAYDRYAKEVTVTLPRNGSELTFDDRRTVAHYDFSVLQTASTTVGPVRPFLGVGGGLGVGYFSTLEPPLSPGDARMVRPLLRAGAGADVGLSSPRTRLGLELDYAHLFRKPTFTTDDGRHLSIFGDRLTVSLWLRQAL